MHDEIIEPVLFLMDKQVGSHAQAVQQLLGTAATESHFVWRKQLGGNPTRGLWQMELTTKQDIWKNYLAYNKKLSDLVKTFRQDYTPGEMEWNDAYACAMARVHYLRVPRPLPQVGDLQGQAEYYKYFFNTPLGAGTPAKYIADWKRYVEGT